MEDKKRCKFDFVAFLAVLILIAFIGCMCFAIAFGIKQQKNLLNVAYADSTNGVVEDNLCLFNDLSVLSVDFSSTGVNSFVVPWESSSQNIRAGYNLGASLNNNVFSSVTLQSSTWATFAYRFINLPIGTYTATYKVSNVSGYVRMVIQGFLNGNFDSNGLCSLTFTTSSVANRDLQIQIQSNSSVTIEWVKLEQGSSFTGYVPKDYENYGYNQGYTEGLDNNIDMRNYIRVGSLDYNSRQVHPFTLDTIDYGISNYIEDSYSLYGYHNPNFAMIQPDEGDDDNEYEALGCKFSSDLLYGDILITFPYVLDTFGSDVFNYSILLIDTVDGTRLYSTVNDTLHWQYSNHLGNINNRVSMSVDYYTFHFFASHVVDIYFICIGSNVESAYTWYPLDDPSFAVYSTQSLTALSSFDEGFQQGLKEGADSAVQVNAQAVANARAEGYERGRRDALGDGNDYSFMGLLGAVFDAPIKSFQGLLNFDVLGVNMQSFVLALLSLSVIIIIIKIALGGK